MKRTERVKIKLAATAAAIGLVGAIPTAAQASTTYIGCAATDGKTVTPRVAPANCNTWYPGIIHAESSGYLTHLSWRKWRSSSATATAIMRYHDARIRARVTAYRPRSVFSMRAYTRLRVTTRYGTGTQQLPWGYDLWPEL